MTKSIIIEKYLKGSESIPKETDFIIKDIEFNENKQLEKDELLMSLAWASADPYVRGRLTGNKTYIDPFKLGEAIENYAIGKVLRSNSEKYKVGDYIVGILPYQEKFYYKVKLNSEGDDGLLKVDTSLGAPIGSFLGILGSTGLTAYLCLMEIGKPKKGETIVVSTGAGAVGSVVGQLSKLLGLYVIGITSSQEKVNVMKNEFGYDVGLNYNSPNFKDELKQAVQGRGIDIYYDNVGGPISDNMWKYLNKFARVAICGTISNYNSDLNDDVGPRFQFDLLRTSATVQGFMIFNYSKQVRDNAFQQLAKYLNQGLIKDKSVVYEGFDQIIPSFIKLFTERSNVGKVVINLENSNLINI